ncbi:hypothetical protein AVEN_48643-1 [Araneus ventricosus]|uniref:C2H2-type domain-containing protein n=1 Tax=Araneus ventricosus TaxID=182803 RepID=A0A4Y2SAD9_ARAVE|nr:hypothetical protein AVEN_48643-1 [Araneus ventricosus]
MALKAFTWNKNNLCGCCFKKKQPKEFYFDDVNVEPSTSGYPNIDYPIFEENLNGKANNGRNFLASGDYMNAGKKWKSNRRRYKCGTCAYKSTTKKGLRWHMITAHKKDVQSKRTADAYGRPLNFFGDILEKTQNEQKYQGEIYDGDDDFDKQMKWAISESISMAAARGHFDSDTDDVDDKSIKFVTYEMIQKMKMKPLKIE